MKDRRKEAALVASGIVFGATLAAPAAGAALMAQQSSQKITVDGKPVQIEAYSINGSNYAKLCDVGRAVVFAVEYDVATNTVQISTKSEYKEDIASNGLRTVVLPTDGSQYIPQVGDLIPCDDGTTYEAKNVVRWDTNVFQDGPLPPLPAPTCDWSAFQTLTLQPPVAKRYNDQYGDTLFVRNVYEVRRMVYTIYNALGDEPEAWRDGKPLFKIHTEIPPEYEPYTGRFWPWRSEEITSVVHDSPNVRYYIDAHDEYKNGVFLNTRYLFMSI